MTRTEPDRREALALAAFDIVAREGMEGLRLRHVAQAVGIDHSTLHHYFASKQELVRALVVTATRPLWNTMPSSGTPSQRLHEHLATLASLIGERPDLFVVLAEIDLRARRDADVRAITNEYEAGWRRALADIFLSGSHDGSWREGFDPAAVVELVIAAVKGVRLNPTMAPDVLALLETALFDGEVSG